MKFLLLLLLAAALMAGCSARPSSTIEVLSNRVDAGDFQGIGQLLDRPKINADLIRQAIGSLGLDPDFMKGNAESAIKQADYFVKLKVWTVFDNEVKKGKGSVFSGLEMVKEGVDGKQDATVLVQLADGKQTTFRLALRNGHWLITGLDLGLFSKIEAKPSVRCDKIKLVEQYIGKSPDDQFRALLRPELQQLLGNDYRTLINNLAVSGQVRRAGRYIVLDGNAPLSGGSDEGIITLDSKTGILSAAVMRAGKVYRFSDIKGEENYPYLIKSWNRG
jgi:hypothetical protein